MPLPASRILALWMALWTAGTAAEPSGVWLDVPFVKQEKNECGVAAIAMVMRYWMKGESGTPPGAEPAEIRRSIYSRNARGVFASDMQRYFQDQGFRAFVFEGGWADLKHHLAQGRPLIVCLEGDARGAALHYVVVTGLDWQPELVLLNDPAQRKLIKLDRKSFEKSWHAAGNWTLLALPKQGD